MFRQGADQTDPVSIAREVSDGGDEECRLAAASLTTGSRTELHLAGRQRHIGDLVSEAICGHQGEEGKA